MKNIMIADAGTDLTTNIEIAEENVERIIINMNMKDSKIIE